MNDQICNVCGRTERPMGACETGGALCPWTTQRFATTMSEKHESEDEQREWVCSNGTIVTDHIDGALAGRLHLESTAGETVLVPAAELLQFLSDHDIERQLAEVTAERDAIKRRVEELERERVEQNHASARREAELQWDLSLLSEKTELERMLAVVPEEEAIDRASLTARLRVVEATIAKHPPPRAAQGG